MAARRRTRARGEESRQRILDAALEIAGERGYDGTSIAGVSARSGLPASSIYWHFEDKDHLIAAVIEQTFRRWLEDMGGSGPAQPGASRDDRFRATIRRTARALEDSPHFLRLGLMLALERRPAEASARKMFLQVREHAYKQIVASYEGFFGDEVGAEGVRRLATLTMAAADGLFVAWEVDQRVDVDAEFELLAEAILGAVEHLSRTDSSS